MAVGHEPEGGEGLLLGDLGDVVPELFVGLARVAGASLGFHDGEHVAACVVQAIVGDAVPRLRVIAINWNLQSDLGAVVEFPVSSPQLRVDLQGTGLGFVESHGVMLSPSPRQCYHFGVRRERAASRRHGQRLFTSSVSRTLETSVPDMKDLSELPFLNFFQDEYGETVWNWNKGFFSSPVFPTEENALEAWRNETLEFSSADDEDLLGALYTTAEVNDDLKPPFDYWCIDGSVVMEPNPYGAVVGKLPKIDVGKDTKMLKMTQRDLEWLQAEYDADQGA